MIPRASTSANSSRERLARISHHFLSDEQPSASQDPGAMHKITHAYDTTPVQNAQPYILPILMGLQQENKFPVYALSQALLSHKTSSAVMLVEGELSSASSTIFTPYKAIPDQDPFNQLLQQTRYQHNPDIYLIPVAGVCSPYVTLTRRLLIPVEATLNGVRDAYLRIKRTSDSKQQLAIGIIFLKCNDPDWARRCFAKLADGTRSFLDITIASYGYLPERAFPWPFIQQLENDQNVLQHELIEIADMLKSDLEKHRQTGKENIQENEPSNASIGFP